MKSVCFIFNYPAHYRLPVYKMLDQEIDCDIYIKNESLNIKTFDPSLLRSFKGFLKITYLIKKPIFWQFGTCKLAFKSYRQYIITGEYYGLSNWFLLLLCKLTNKKVYLWTHGLYGNESKIQSIIKNWFFKLSDGLLLYGNYSKNLLIKSGFDIDKLHVIYNSLDYARQRQIYSELDHVKSPLFFSDTEPLRLIYIGRLQKRKKLEMLLVSMSRLIHHGFSVKLLIVGSGDILTDLQDKARILDIQASVEFYGAIYEEVKIAELLNESHLCVSPGNVGLTAIHSMTYGVPVLTHGNSAKQMPEFEAVIPNVTGLLFDENSVEDLIDKIRKFYHMKLNERDEMQQKCLEIIKKKYNARYQLKLFKQILNISLK